jgi:hypothetical protein
MSQSFNPFRTTHLESLRLPRSRGAAIYTHPDDVASDPDLTLAERRAVLASWISDARAVEDSPSLRRLDSGAVVEVDAILRALVLLDEIAPGRRGDCGRLTPSGRRRGVISRLLRRVGPASGANLSPQHRPMRRRWRRKRDELRQLPQILGGGGQQELIFGSVWPSQA